LVHEPGSLLNQFVSHSADSQPFRFMLKQQGIHALTFNSNDETNGQLVTTNSVSQQNRHGITHMNTLHNLTDYHISRISSSQHRPQESLKPTQFRSQIIPFSPKQSAYYPLFSHILISSPHAKQLIE